MRDELWERRRDLLADNVRRAADALLEHTRAASFYLPASGGRAIACGLPDTLPGLIRSANEPIKD